jgi:uncharacterized protein YkwD
MEFAELEKLRSSVVSEHNRLRADPAEYIVAVDKQRKFIDKKNILRIPGRKPIKLREGVKIYEEIGNFLYSNQPIKTITYDERLSEAAQEYAEYLGKNGIVAIGENLNGESLNLSQRIEKFCEWENICAENIDYGSYTAQDILISFLASDGDSNRSQRINLFNKNLKYFGVGVSCHKIYGIVCVTIYTGGVRDQGSLYHDLDTFKFEYPNLKQNVDKFRINKICLKDSDAPENTKSVDISKSVLNAQYEGRKRFVIKKQYSLNDGNRHIVEIENLI